MRFMLARTMAIVIVVVAMRVLYSAAQSATAPAPPKSAQPQQQGTSSGGTVIFSRSTDESGKTTTTVGPGADRPEVQIAREPSVEDADRRSIIFTALDLDVHLHSALHQIAVRALITVRNGGKSPLSHIPLQISSSLNWEQIRVAGRSVSFPVVTLNSDADHTGQLHEAAVPLALPLAPGATLQLDVAYSGSIEASAQRLVTVGAPETVALHSDWDEISVPFTGLRGFGNVVWYPVSTVPVILGDGARLFDEIGRHKLQLSGAQFGLNLTIEFPHGEPPTVALVNGLPVSLTVADAHGLDPDLAGIATARVENVTLGFEAPSLFVADRKAHPGANLTAWTLPDNEVAIRTWMDAATTVSPFLRQWLGQHPRDQLTLLDLPDPDDVPFETGALLVASLHEGPADKLDRVLVHALTHAYTRISPQPSPAWLNEGLATFMESLWIEKHGGRDQALGMLEADRNALALLEPPSPGESAGVPLASAIAPVYYRTKAAYVLWMLRDLTNDDALSSAFRLFDSEAPASSQPANDRKVSLPCPLEGLLKQVGVTKDLSWFFADWVNADKGLPDLSIESVFPNAAQGGTFLVAVNVSNAGYASAEVPVTVKTARNSVTDRIFIPARGRAVQRLVVMGAPTQVQVNDGTIPETQASVHVTDVDQPPSSEPATGASFIGQEPPAPQ
jgi:hypothetical protein